MRLRTMHMAWVVALLLLAGACGGVDRPTVAEWTPAWDEIRAAVPQQDALGDPPDQTVCSSALGEVRKLQEGLLPTPDLAVDDVIREWVRVVEAAMFECPPSTPEIPDMDAAYAELARLEAEVAAGLGA